MVTIMNVAAPPIKATPKGQTGPYAKNVYVGKTGSWNISAPATARKNALDPRLARWGPRHVMNLK